MDSLKVNLSSLSNKNLNKIRDKDEYILSMANITKEELELLNDEKYNKILDAIQESIAKTETIKDTTNLISTNNIIQNTKENNKIDENKVENKIESEDFKKEVNINEELFSNYKSDFKKEENNIFKSLREKKLKIHERLRMPKTRISLLIGLVFISIIIISSLFILDPEHHSYSKYKANILELESKYFNKEINNTSTITYENIQIDDFSFNIIKEKTKNSLLYKYNGTTFLTKAELNAYLNKEVSIKNEKLRTLTGSALEEYKQEILRDALKNKYQK